MITLESTTDSKEAIEAAVGGSKPKELEVKKESEQGNLKDAERKVAEESDVSEEDEADQEVESDESHDDVGEPKEKPKKKGGFKKRIDKLTRENYQKAQEIEFLRSQIAKTQTQKEPEEKTQKQASGQKPKADDFETHEEFVEAMADFKAEEKLKKLESRRQEESLKEKIQKREADYSNKVESFKSEHSDFDEVLEDASDIQMPGPVFAVFKELLEESENPGLLMYELAKNRDEYERISKLSPLGFAREIGKFETKIQKTLEPKKEIKKTKAPAPIEPVGGRSSQVAMKTPEEMDFREFKKWREKQIQS